MTARLSGHGSVLAYFSLTAVAASTVAQSYGPRGRVAVMVIASWRLTAMTASETVAIVGRNILRPRQRPVVDVPQVLELERFVEKPPKPAAAAMLAAGEHFWNSGMFVFRADRILAELARHAPAIERAVEAAFAALGQAPGDGWQVPLDLY